MHLLKKLLPSLQNARPKQLIFAGLGNPGLRYEMTRHNLGFMVLKALAGQLSVQMKEEKRFKAFVGKVEVEGVVLHLIMPLTYMNLSGSALRHYMSYFKLLPMELTVVVDDLFLPFGSTRLLTQGGCGGHNGLKSIEQELKTSCYNRLRMGVGKPPEHMAKADYVLQPFSATEQEKLDEFVAKGKDILFRLVTHTIDQVMCDTN